MKVVQINTVCGSGSTGKICVAISDLLTNQGIKNYIFYASGNNNYPLGRRYMFPLEVKWQALKSRIFGNYGFNSKIATKQLIEELEDISPDIVHLHNLHGHNVHLGLLFSYLRNKNIKIFWTFHDCWAITAYCPHYDMVGCNQWKNGGCQNCPQLKNYSWFFDRSQYLFKKKKELFVGLDLTIITPSQWLAGQVKQSFISEYEARVINNGIDLSIFTPHQSDFKEKHQLKDKFIVLGVAFGWGVRKGLDVFIELSRRLDDRFQIVLVGTDEKVDKQLPDNIISINQTQNQTELVEIYTVSDVFVNPTREEVLGLTNIEALACGTPVITFKTGGSVECVDNTCGFIVNKDDITSLQQSIEYICINKPYHKDDCLKKARAFSADLKYKEYVDLYIEKLS